MRRRRDRDTGSAPARWHGRIGPVAVGYRPPVSGALTVLRRFDPPRTVYGPGHLGVDLALGPGEAVLAAGAGMVRFAGPVAGRGVVVVAHPDGISTEYEPVQRAGRGPATSVRPGQPIGRLAGDASRLLAGLPALGRAPGRQPTSTRCRCCDRSGRSGCCRGDALLHRQRS